MRIICILFIVCVTANSQEYLKESKLPVGWPEPGPFNLVVEKEYPESRVALTYQGSRTFGFWKLFSHIKKNNIPMTSPVVMRVSDDEMKQQDMQFLYQSPEVGTKGQDDGVLIKDLEATKAICYAWVGENSKEMKGKAKAKLSQYLEEKNLTDQVKYWRMLGYNSPSVPDDEKCWELQVLLEKK